MTVAPITIINLNGLCHASDYEKHI